MRHWSARVACAALISLGLASLGRPALAAGIPARDLSEPIGKAGEPHMQPADLPGIEARLAEKGVAAGNPIMIRIFKFEAELEVWVLKGSSFVLLATHPICHWSGQLGPKLTEGDKQSPEGFYSIGSRQLHRTGRWRRSLDIGFPNTFDRAHGRTGSYILVHGGCTSVGCYAMTTPVMEEIYKLSEAALREGQERIPVHVFPFRMTEANLAAHADSEWSSFWGNLQAAYDLFERTRVPPYVGVCSRHYVVSESEIAETTECTENESEVRTARAPSRRARILRHAGRAASRGRGARRAYAVARAERMAAHAKRRHATASAKSQEQ